MSNVAVTGASGYLGRKLLEVLDADASVTRVVGVDLADPSFGTRNLESYRMDVRSTAFADAIGGCDALVHLASMRSFGNGTYDALAEAVIDAADAAGVRKLVYVSGGSSGEELVRSFADTHPDVVVTLLRFGWVGGSSLPASHEPPADASAPVVHEQDAGRALAFVLARDVPGSFDVRAGDGPAGGSNLGGAGFEYEHSADDVHRAVAEARRGWVTVGGVRFRPRWAVATAVSLAAVAIGSRLRRSARPGS